MSVPANIAEGFVKKSIKDKGRYFNIAQGSLQECRYYLILAKDLEYGDVSKLQKSITELSKILDSYVRSMLASGSLNSASFHFARSDLKYALWSSICYANTNFGFLTPWMKNQR